MARDSYDPSVEASASWLPDVVCQLDTEALEALRWWHSRMVSGGRPRRICWREETRGCLWGPAVLQHLPGDDQVEQLDGHIAVITTDASGWAGGAWLGQRRLHYAFTDAQLAGLYGGSANLRELYVPPFTVEKWQPRGVLVLFRMDSAASVGAINRRGSMVPHFNALVLQLMELLEALGSEAVAHSPLARQGECPV